MITYFQAIILGAIQGITELFPISSLGHSVILPTLFHWNINQSANNFIIFLVATHFATALVLFGFFFKDWTRIIQGVFRSMKNRIIDERDIYAKIGWLIIVASIPAGIIGLLFQDTLQSLFAVPKYAALFLIFNGCILYGAELLRRRKIQSENKNTDEEISKTSWLQSIEIGAAQCLALIPGFSRTGSTLGGGLLAGLNHEEAARFSFLLATPIIFAASALKLPELFTANATTDFFPICAGFFASGIAAYFSVRFLTKYFKTKTLTPFAIYCISAGIIASVILFLR
jgi:undecaprenyl-diphosphatase